MSSSWGPSTIFNLKLLILSFCWRWLNLAHEGEKSPKRQLQGFDEAHFFRKLNYNVVSGPFNPEQKGFIHQSCLQWGCYWVSSRNIPVDRFHMCPCRVRLEKRSCGFLFFIFFFLSFNHPDKVQSSGTVWIESCAAESLSSCEADEWDNQGDKLLVH